MKRDNQVQSVETARDGASAVPVVGRASEAFGQRLQREAAVKRSWVCLGLDIDLTLLPAGLPRSIDGARQFLRSVIDATVDLVVAFKPNLAFYAALGPDGWRLLQDTVEHVSGRAMILGDGKVGDVENTSKRYAVALFDTLQLDAITVNPYGGLGAIAPLLARRDRGVFVWTRSSNAGADEFQGLHTTHGRPLFLAVARAVADANVRDNLGLVVGATYPNDLAAVREAAPALPILLPGVGAQGGALEASLRAGHRPPAGGLIVNAGRSALWASDGPDYAAACRKAVEAVRDAINLT